ncbi:MULTISPECIES: type I restriction endonuclease [Kocuria]|uniref:type I restriction endonuclease n=1 Tax=Kocuria TaxID=57493 RepID=UPI0008A5ADE4|nr:type I restriction endonuclease [Kocuria sp. HMSC066H03]MXN62718.1 restriction endonuclease [Bacillus sp. BGMRC0062]OFK06865.1 restriction endonuclease [Kocuria sp. HMSC066H03]WSY88247.1 type I restriction enzyme HsdR N-terminal domain-containing protein [Kocuria rhizophila]WSZ53674.1 type I restriction enzyme HsdR N-terminal domain-containing protein [Kocuria rhizophila]
MDFAERLSALATKVAHQKAALETEEATKNAFVMPFISTILGYDVFNPSEVVPEFTADVGVKKGEKIDYAIVQDGQIQMLIECKHVGSPLSLEHASQLYRYFAVTNARIAVLTNGEKYHFYTDLDAPNRMDAKPFLVLDLLDIDTTLLPELLKLSKTEFDLDSIISAAGELKYVGQIKRAIAAEFKDPSDDWIRFFTNRVYEGAFTQKVREQFTPLVGKASQQFLNEQVNNRLATALGAGSTPPPLPPEVDPAGEISSQEEAVRDLEETQEEIITTAEELSAFNIVRAIVCNQVDMSRVSYRDAKSYCAILLDNNNRKTIARLHFNRSQKYIGILDENKIETRHPLDALEQIYTLSDQLRATVERLSA